MFNGGAPTATSSHLHLPDGRLQLGAFPLGDLSPATFPRYVQPLFRPIYSEIQFRKFCINYKNGEHMPDTFIIYVWRENEENASTVREIYFLPKVFWTRQGGSCSVKLTGLTSTATSSSCESQPRCTRCYKHWTQVKNARKKKLRPTLCFLTERQSNSWLLAPTSIFWPFGDLFLLSIVWKKNVAGVRPLETFYLLPQTRTNNKIR